jgi:hypothetical protein
VPARSFDSEPSGRASLFSTPGCKPRGIYNGMPAADRHARAGRLTDVKLTDCEAGSLLRGPGKAAMWTHVDMAADSWEAQKDRGRWADRHALGFIRIVQSPLM